MCEEKKPGNPRIYLGEDEVCDIFPEPCVVFNIHWPHDNPGPLTLGSFEDKNAALAYVQTLIGDLQAARRQIKSYFAYYAEPDKDTP